MRDANWTILGIAILLAMMLCFVVRSCQKWELASEKARLEAGLVKTHVPYTYTEVWTYKGNLK